MHSLHPLVLAFFSVLAVALVGGIAAFIRDRRRFSGFEDLTNDVLKLGKALQAQVFRDGADLVVNGTWRGAPVDIRFSNSENTPGTDIRMGAAANFTMFVSPRNINAPEGAATLRTPNEMFNARAQVRSNHPTQCGMFLSNKDVVPAVVKLYRSSNTYFRLTQGLLELRDLEPPKPEGVRAVTSQLEQMSTLAERVKAMPGSTEVVIEPLKRERRYLFKAAMLAGIATMTFAILFAAFDSNDAPELPKQQFIPEGINAEDASLISGVQKWRVAQEHNFDQDAVAWLKGNRMEPIGRVAGDFTGSGKSGEVAYVLVQPEGDKRVLILNRERVLYEIYYPYVGIAARVRKEIVPGIAWKWKPPEVGDGDGLLILRTANDPTSGLVIFIKGDRVITAVPKDYRMIKLE